MALDNVYTSAEAVKDNQQIQVSDGDDDAAIENAINAASRTIEGWCGQRFWLDDSDTTRYFTAQSPRRLYLPGRDPDSATIVTLTSLALDTTGDGTFDITWTEDVEFFLSPRGASSSGRPYHAIHTLAGYSLPCTPEGVRIVGAFGWPSIPDPVVTACEIEAGTIFKRVTEGAAPIVTIDGTSLHSSKFLDRQAELLLRRHRLPVIA